ncbi:MAG: helix-turn-helix transcriptional regulator [Clostridia bacterium]|nr:helix-turn-helix transcriptional regulator [Clostridia bacterium]
MVLPEIYDVGLFDSAMKFKMGKESPERICSMYEIEFHNADSGTSFINGKAYKITAGAVVCAKPGYRRHSILPLRSHFIHIKATSPEVNEYLDMLPDFFISQNINEYVELVRRITLSHKFGEERDAMHTYSLLLELLHRLSGETERGVSTSKNYKNSEVIKQAINYMDEHYTSKCSLEEIAASVNFSPIYFHSVFKKAMGITPYQYITNRRMRLAREYLTMSDKTVAEIADSCGFESQSYFNYSFKKEVGITPGQYRRRTMDSIYY